jgi:pyruvate,water dikinase
VAGVIPPTVRHSVPIFEREWRDDLQPRYRAAVTAAEATVDILPVDELPSLVDDLAGLAGESFASVAALTGAAYKMEMNLSRFYRRHLARTLAGSHLPLLAGFEPPTGPDHHAVASLDWWHEPSPVGSSATRSSEEHARLVESRHAAEMAAFRVLASSPRRLRSFRRLLAETQHLVPIREEQTRELTLAWPVMRRAVLRIGEHQTVVVDHHDRLGLPLLPAVVAHVLLDQHARLAAGWRAGHLLRRPAAPHTLDLRHRLPSSSRLFYRLGRSLSHA